MGPCANTSCGQAFIKWKALKEMNAKGVYTPEQLQEYVDNAWDKHNPDGDTFTNKEKCKLMCEQAVNGLGSIGDGYKLNDNAYSKGYSAVDKMGFGKIAKPMVLAMVTKIITDKEGA